MEYVVFSLIVFIIIKCDAGTAITDNPHIIFTRSSSSSLEQAPYYKVVMNKPLYIHFQNMSNIRGWCINYNYYVHEKDMDKAISSLANPIHFRKVTSEMSVMWKCNVTEDKNQTLHRRLKNLEQEFHIFYLNLHVIGAKSVKISINGQELTFSKADLSAPYDGNAVYLYEDGKHVKIVCRNPQRTGTVRLEYVSKGVSNYSFSAKFDLQLHSESHHSYIDCIYITAMPADTYVYRVTFIAKKQLFYSNEIKTQIDAKISASQGTEGKSSPILLGCSIGAALVVLAVIGVACYCVRARNAKHIETPYVDLSNHTDSQTPQNTNASENQYDLCNYSEHLPKREYVSYYNTPEGVEKIDPKDHCYTEIDYFSCKPKIGEAQSRDSKVYDEPYVHITIRMQ